MALILAFVFLTLTTPIDSPCFAQEVTEMGWEEKTLQSIAAMARPRIFGSNPI